MSAESLFEAFKKHFPDKVTYKVIKYTPEQIEENKRASKEIRDFLETRKKHEEMSKNCHMFFK